MAIAERGDRARPRAGGGLLATAGYTLLTVAATHPLAVRLGSAVPGDGTDAWFHLWNLWWVRRALLELHTNPYVCPFVYHPDGASLLFHSLALAPALVAIPIVGLVGLTAAYGLLAAASFVASAEGARRLFLEVAGDDGSPARRLAAFLCGAFFAFSAYRFTHLLGHLDLLSTFVLPFSALHLVRTWRRPGWKDPLAASLWLAVTPLCAWYYWLHLVFLTGALLLLGAIVERGRRDLVAAERRVAAALAASLVWIAPLLVPMLRRGAAAGALPAPGAAALASSADLLGFVVPSPLHPLVGPVVQPLWHRLIGAGNRTEAVVFLGFVPLALAAWAPPGVERRRWAAVLVAFLVLALGPVLHVAGATATIGGRPLALPYHYLVERALPFASVLRAPSRFVAVATLALALLAGMGASRWLARRAAPRAAAALLVALAIAENAVVPFPSSAASASALYERLRADPRDAAILEVPIADDPARFPRRMLLQTIHQKRVFGGYLSRGLPTFPLGRIPGLAPWKTLPADPAGALADDVVAGMGAQDVALATLAFYDTAYVVIDKTLLGVRALGRARSLAAVAFAGAGPYHEDDQVVAYEVPAPSGFRRPLLALADGWDELEHEPAAPAARAPRRWRWMSGSARLAVVAPSAQPCRFYLHAWSLDRERQVAVLLDGDPVGVLAIAPSLGEHALPVAVPAGIHAITLRSLDPPSRRGGRELAVAILEVGLQPALAPSARLRLERSSRPSPAAPRLVRHRPGHRPFDRADDGARSERLG